MIHSSCILDKENIFRYEWDQTDYSSKNIFGYCVIIVFTCMSNIQTVIKPGLLRQSNRSYNIIMFAMWLSNQVYIAPKIYRCIFGCKRNKSSNLFSLKYSCHNIFLVYKDYCQCQSNVWETGITPHKTKINKCNNST